MNLRDCLPESCLDRNGLKSGRHTFLLPKSKGRVLCTIKPIHTEARPTEYLVMVEKLKDVLESVNQMIGSAVHTEFSEIIGKSPVVMSSRQLGEKGGQGDSTVLILGESGTGKELFARAIHTASVRRNEAFIPINCAAIPTIFWKVSCSVTKKERSLEQGKGGYIGKFEMADRGTLFLMKSRYVTAPADKAVKGSGRTGLRQDRFQRTSPINVRIIAATHQDLESHIKLGTFREDLYYRLNVIPLKLPALRDRRSDIPILSGTLHQRNMHQPEPPSMKLDGYVTRTLMDWDWPGNVRELQNTLSYALQMASGSVVTKMTFLNGSDRNRCPWRSR